MNEGPFPNESAAGLSPDAATAYAGTSEPEGSAKRAVLAGLGAAATAYDIANDAFDRFVDRGSLAQEHLLRRADDVRLQRAGNRARMGDALRSAMNVLLDSLNVPNKADVDIINTKLNIVTRKLDDLQFGGMTGTTPAPAAAGPEVVVPADEAQGSIGP